VAPTIKQSLSRHLFCLQQQFLPLLFAKENDLVAVTAFPKEKELEHIKKVLKTTNLPRLVLLQSQEPWPTFSCLSWGPSLQVAKWAKEHQLTYFFPKNKELVRFINSKAFEVDNGPLKKELIYDLLHLKKWFNEESFPKVLKSCFGLSGMGHLIIRNQQTYEKAVAFCTHQWSLGLPVVAEPWLCRLLDFSTQWNLSKQGKSSFIGATVFKTKNNGGYLGTWVGKEEEQFGFYLPFLSLHLEKAEQLFFHLKKMGYFGPIGLDALVYQCSQENRPKLYPIVEINGRQTLSLVALKMQQRFFPDKKLLLSLKKTADCKQTLLPCSLEKFTFKYNLDLTFLD